MSITLYTNPMSRGRIVRWMLCECDADHEAVTLEYGTSMKAPDYLAINPMGKVPALKDGDAIITECAAIILWLADRFPEKQLAPELNSPERAAYYRWISFVSGPVEALMTAKSIGHLAEPTSSGYGSEKDIMDTLEQAIKGKDYVVGNKFTAADLFLAAYISFYVSFKMMEPREELVRYAELHKNRPASMKANELDGEFSMPEPEQA